MYNPKPSVILLSILLLLSSPGDHILLPTFSLAKLLPIVTSNLTQIYIVHLNDPNVSTDLLSTEERDDWYHSFLPNTSLDSGEPRMVFTYDTIMTGFAARLTAEEATAMESIDGFLFAYPEKIHPLHTTYTPKLLGLDQYNSLWEHSNQGESIIIGVMDTGIVPNHPSFADSLKLPPPKLSWHGACDLPSNVGTCNNKLIGAKQFIKHTGTSLDTLGHGTHVAGIAAGSPVYGANVLGLARGTPSGMAPRAHLAIYRVCSGTDCTDSSSLKGIEQALQDGVDIIQISNGSPDEFHTNGNVKGSFRAVDKGIITVCSAQNDGPSPSIISNDAPWILTVGAASTDRRTTAVLKLGNGMEFFGESSYQPDPSGIVDVPFIYPGEADTDETLACQKGSMAGLNVNGKIVFCGKGFNDPVDKSMVVKEAGGVGIIVMNQKWDGDTLWSYEFVIPGIHVTNKDALKILSYFKTDPNPTGSITYKGTEFGIRPSPTVAAFSSRGPSLRNGGILKPDVIAPGVDILSAWPFHFNGSSNPRAFSFKPGTSMAAPHVSGIAALIKKTHPDWSPAMIKSAIMTTAYTKDRDGNKITDDASNSRRPANAFAVGAGHVNPSAAEDPGLVYDTPVDDYIPYLCGFGGVLAAYKVILITNRKVVSCTKKMATEELNYPSILVSMGLGVKKKTIPRTVTNVGEPKSVYKATVTEPKGVKVDVNPKTLEFASVREQKNFTVEISLTGSPPVGEDVWEGRLEWVSGKYVVSSPIVIVK